MSDLSDLLARGTYDFLDFGCSKGDSLRLGQEGLGGARGLGLDLDPRKVAETAARGYDAVEADVAQLKGLPDRVRFVIMSHFLEHLHGFRNARSCIEAACTTATEFVLIRQPWFDADGYLFEHGLKLYWSDWRGHNYAMSQLDFHRIVSRIPKVRRWTLSARRPIGDSSDAAVHPLDSPTDQHAWSAEVHPPKPAVRFSAAVFYEIICLIELRDGLDAEEILSQVRWDRRLYDSAAPPG